MTISVCKKRGVRYYSDPDNGVTEVPSVSSVLNLIPKPRLTKWALKQSIDFLVKRKNITPEIISKTYGYHTHYLNKLADEGTANHKLMDDYLEGKDVKINKWLQRFINWKDENDFKVTDIEKTVIDPKLGFAGTMDLVGTIHGEPIIVDLKTSSEIRFSHKVQVCAYKVLYGSIHHKVAILDIPRSANKTSWYILTESEEEEYTALFFNALNFFNQLDKVGELEL